MRAGINIMSENTKLPWVVITGLIREPETVNHLFDFLSNLKKRNIIEQVVFSTWHNELNRYPVIEKQVVDNEFLVIEAAPPALICMGSFLHQAEALRNGLQLCPGDAFIFKMRTDKCEPALGFMKDEILNFLQARNYIFPLSHQDFVLNYKIGVHAASAFSSTQGPVLFWWIDFFYFGYKQDLVKLVNYNILSRDYNGLIPEQTLFANLFTPVWTVLDMYFRYVHSHHAVISLYEQRKNLTEEEIANIARVLTSNKLFKMAFITERFLLHKYAFDIYSAQSFPFEVVYCGIDLTKDVEMIPYIKALFEGQVRFDLSELEIYGEQLQEFLHHHCNIIPLYHRTLETKGNRFQIATPTYSISFKPA